MVIVADASEQFLEIVLPIPNAVWKRSWTGNESRWHVRDGETAMMARSCAYVQKVIAFGSCLPPPRQSAKMPPVPIPGIQYWHPENE